MEVTRSAVDGRPPAATNLFTSLDFELTLVAGLPSGELAHRLALAMRGGDVCHRALAFYLHDLETRRAYQELGYASAIEFARHRLDMSKGRARDLLLVGRKLQELPHLDAAFAAGELSWSKVRRVARVAVPATEQAWIERALQSTHDDVDALVNSAQEGDAPRSLDRGLPHARFIKRFALDSVRHQMFERARDKLAAELRRVVTDDDVLDEMLRLLLASSADGSVPGRAKVDDSLFRVVVAEGDAAPDDPPTSAAASDAAVAGRLRQRVLDRDAHRCRACDSCRSLMIHHVVWRSHGGATTRNNLVTLCARCHGLVHEEWLRVEKDAAGGFRLTDREGRNLHTRHPDIGPALRVTCAVAHGAGDRVEAAARASLLTEDDIPDVVDGEWYRRHEHLLEWRGGSVRVRRGGRQVAEPVPPRPEATLKL